ncbi:alpha-1-antichymotrypsin isoform X3 [Prionailurus iriomotensis]
MDNAILLHVGPPPVGRSVLSGSRLPAHASKPHLQAPSPSIAPKLAKCAFGWHHELAHHSNNNITCSPMSVAIAFSMLSLGTNGDIRTQILQGLDFNFKETPEANIYKGLQRLDSQCQLTARSIPFIDKNWKQVHTFSEEVRKLDPSEAFSVHFRDNKEAKKWINQYIEKETQGKTVDFIKDLGKDTALVLNVTDYSGATPSEGSTWSKHLSVKFNRSFLVIIRDESTNIPLFVGKMVNPMQK